MDFISTAILCFCIAFAVGVVIGHVFMCSVIRASRPRKRTAVSESTWTPLATEGVRSMFIKAPTDILDYTWDWSTWLPTGDTISTVNWTATSGVTVETTPPASSTTTTATVWLGGGTTATTYEITCQITTAAGRVSQNTQQLYVENL